MELQEKTDIKSMTYERLRREMESLGEKPYRADQIFGWMHQKLACGFDEMTNIARPLQEKLGEHYRLPLARIERVQTSAGDGTRKYLFALEDGQLIESVFLPYRHGNTVCVSSQAGCRMGCSFCASAIGGLVRNLTPSEMLEQVYAIMRHTGERVSNVVVMGMGEPLDNYENLLCFISLLNDPRGLRIGQRNVTVSTCGITERIRALADENLQITLAVSLHAPNQKLRETLLPIARRYTLDGLMRACDEYFAKTGRRVTYEYSLIGGVNDSDGDARALARLLGGRGVHVNLIPLNPVKSRNYRSPDSRRVAAFKNILEKNQINVTIRREMGRDIEGACGQLRLRQCESA